METLRMTMNSARLAPVIDLPAALRDREVEVIVKPSRAVSGVAKPNDDEPRVKSIMGILKEYADPALRELDAETLRALEKEAWPQAAVEKHLEKMKDGRY